MTVTDTPTPKPSVRRRLAFKAAWIAFVFLAFLILINRLIAWGWVDTGSGLSMKSYASGWIACLMIDALYALRRLWRRAAAEQAEVRRRKTEGADH